MEAQCINLPKKHVGRLCPTLRNNTRRKAIAVLDFLAINKDMYDHCNIQEVKLFVLSSDC